VWGFLAGMSRARAQQGFNTSETATFVFSFKQPLFARLRLEVRNAEELAEDMWTITVLLDKLGLYTAEVFQQSREDMITRQQQDLLELSTPVVKLWEGILALPLIGTLDSARTQVVMESLLQRIVETGASIAIIDITGVPAVDTLVAQHLIKTVAAARLMGADCIISGIRPQIAQTIVHLGIAHAGEEAIAMAQQAVHDIIFIDMRLPTINGLETYLAIRGINREVVAVMMTAYRQEMAELVEEALKSSAYTCLYKPMEMEELLRPVEEIRERRQGSGGDGVTRRCPPQAQRGMG
jgi:anti-anti-sigma regulatory factor